MKNILKLKQIFWVILLFLLTHDSAQAAGGLIENSLLNKFYRFGNSAAVKATYNTANPSVQFETLLSNIILGVLGFTGAIFFIFVIYSGLQWLTAAGNEEKIKKAKNRIVQSSVGLLITFGAFMVTALFFYPIYNKFLTTPGKTNNSYLSGGSGLDKIPCDNDGQCSGSRHFCDVGNHNCVECVKGDDAKSCVNTAEICTDWGTCSAGQSGDCTGLSENTCGQRSDCQIQYDFGSQAGLWVASCVSKATYKCSPACSGDTKNCTASGKCIQCRTKDDCPHVITAICSEQGICTSF